MDISERMPKYLASYVMVLAAWGSLALSATASAQVHDGLTVTATTAVLYDATSGIYTYNYTFVNSLQSTQEADFIAIAFSNDRKPPILNISSPTGWSFLPSADRNVALWGATDVGTVPANYADDGNVLPSPYQIKPGQSTRQFSTRRVSRLCPPRQKSMILRRMPQRTTPTTAMWERSRRQRGYWPHKWAPRVSMVFYLLLHQKMAPKCLLLPMALATFKLRSPMQLMAKKSI